MSIELKKIYLLSDKENGFYICVRIIKASSLCKTLEERNKRRTEDKFELN